MKQKPLVRLSPDTHKRAKIASVAIGMPLNSLVDEAVEDWMKRNSKRIVKAAGASGFGESSTAPPMPQPETTSIPEQPNA